MTNQLNIEPLHNDFGARVTGIVLSGDLSNADVVLIGDAIDSYSILCFPDQDMTDEKQLALTRCQRRSKNPPLAGVKVHHLGVVAPAHFMFSSTLR